MAVSRLTTTSRVPPSHSPVTRGTNFVAPPTELAVRMASGAVLRCHAHEIQVTFAGPNNMQDTACSLNNQRRK